MIQRPVRPATRLVPGSNGVGHDNLVRTVVVIDGHPLYREALVRLIESEGWARVVGAVSSVEEYEQHVRTRPALAVLDPHLAGRPGLTGPAAVARLAPDGVSVLVVTEACDEGSVLGALTAGARGYLPKSAEGREVTVAIRSVAHGASYVAPSLTGHLLQAARVVDRGKDELTAREQEVLALVANGATDQAVARRLSIAVATVRSHLDRIRDKTGRRRRSDLTRYAIETGIADRSDMGDTALAPAAVSGGGVGAGPTPARTAARPQARPAARAAARPGAPVPGSRVAASAARVNGGTAHRHGRAAG
jgi:DNA-binding NarL/FixJ family response regulator